MKKILLLVLPLITFSFVFAECDLAFMQPGYQGSKVIALQKYLQTNGYYTATLSARYDTTTVSAIKKLQAKNALLATGLIDQKTQLLLASTLCANSQAVKVEEVDLNSTATPLLSALENQAFSLPNGLEFTSVGREKAFLAKGVVLKPLPNFISGEFSYMMAIASTSLTKENPEKPWLTQTPYDSFVFYGSSTIPVYSDVDIISW